MEWVKNPAKVIASGDEYANKIYNEYNKSQMTAFTSYTDTQILSILAYVKAYQPPQEGPSPSPDVKLNPNPAIPTTYLNVIIAGMILILVLMVVILGLIVSALKRFLNQKDLDEDDAEVVNSPYSVSSIT
ncbi:MAG: cytochrome C, partial [Flammeovirgaceae bacterium]